MSGLRRAGSKEDIFCKVTQCCVRSIDTHPGVAQLCFWSKQAVVCRIFGTQSLGTNGVMAAWVSPPFILPTEVSTQVCLEEKVCMVVRRVSSWS
jgi:hypothetical protein